MSKGIIILCMSKPQYACAAYNLALSIKFHSPDIHITLLSDGIHNKAFSGNHFAPFNSIKEIPFTDVCEAKLNIANYSDYKQTLYIDADSICVNPIELIFDKLKGNDFKSNVIPNYTTWTSDEKFESFFGCLPTQLINSSWIYFEKKSVFKEAIKFFKKGFNREDLSDKWGNYLPDEMFFNGAISKLGVDCKTDLPLMYFDTKGAQDTIQQITSTYNFVTYFGNNSTSRLLLREWYDKEMFRVAAKYNLEHRFKMPEIMAHKLVNDK